MLQRIQTIYLTISVVFLLLFLVFPKGYLEFNGIQFNIQTWVIKSADGENLEYSSMLGLLGSILPVMIMAFTTFIIFLYKKRLLQIRYGKLNILAHTALVVITFFYLDGIKSEFPGYFRYGVAIVFPLVSMLFILFANKAIRKDENLVRAADRLR